MSEPAPYFRPDSRSHLALQALTTGEAVDMEQLRRACGVNPKSSNGRRKFWYALQCLMANGCVEDRCDRHRQAYAITPDGVSLLQRLDNGESVYGVAPSQPNVRVFA